nr:MAG TPA: hypothetical protein [Caudoviricetes sp.]
MNVRNRKNDKDNIWWKRLSVGIMEDWARSPDEGCVNRIYGVALQ